MSDNPLRKAHDLSAEASILLKPGQPASMETLTRARDIYHQATGLFERALVDQKGEEEKKTLNLLVNQHKKLVRDVERRIGVAQRAAAAAEASAAASGSRRHSLEDVDELGRGGLGSPGARTTSRRATGEGFSPKRESVGLASAANIGTWPAGVSTRLGPPPFAMRPANLPPPLPRAVTSPASTSPTTSRGTGDQYSRSPMHSSSSSDESFLNLGAIPDTLDPFSRFWGMLENMLDDISNPVAFASAPLGIHADGPGPLSRIPSSTMLSSDKRVTGRQKERDSKRGKEKEPVRDPSPAESFYLVRREKDPGRSSSPYTADTPPQQPIGVNGKTPEELALENENLRKSLDEIASHAEKLDRANKVLQAQHDEREKVMKSIAMGVRREAQKVKHGQEMIRSQLIASVTHPRLTGRGAAHDPSSSISGIEEETALQARVRELEDEVTRLKAENERQKAQTDKYKDKLSQIKASAKAKRDAKLANGENTRPGSSRRLAEDI